MDTLSKNRLKGIASTLIDDPLFQTCKRHDISRMLSISRIVYYSKGSEVCEAGESAQLCWYVLAGEVLSEADNGPAVLVTQGIVGEEAVLGLEGYLSTLEASTDITLLCIPRSAMPASLLETADARADALCYSLLRVKQPGATHVALEHQDSPVFWSVTAWLLVVLCPLSIVILAGESPYFDDDHGERWRQLRMCAVLVCGGLLWSFRLVKPYIAALLMLFLILSIEIVPSATVLSGFSSNAFFMTLSLFGMSAVISSSGLVTRMVLWVVDLTRASPTLRQGMVLVLMVLIAPLLPSKVRRLGLWHKLLPALAQYKGLVLPKRAEQFYLTVYQSSLVLFLPVFLTGAAANMALYGSLPEQVQMGVTWLSWVKLGAVFTVLVFSLYLLIVIALSYVLSRKSDRSEEYDVEFDYMMAAQRSVLGKFSLLEWIVAGCIVLYAVAVMSTGTHRIDHRLVALIVLSILLMGEFLGKSLVKHKIDWNYLFLLAAIVGIGKCIVSVGLPDVILAATPTLALFIQDQPELFILGVGAVSVVVNRFIMHGSVLAGLIIVPLSVVNGFNPLLSIFVILVAGQCWENPAMPNYRRDLNLPQEENALSGTVYYSAVHIVLFTIRFIAIAASIYYWQYLGMI